MQTDLYVVCYDDVMVLSTTGVRNLYHASIYEKVKKEHLLAMLEGFVLDEKFVRVDKASYVKDDPRQIGIEIHSGRKPSNTQEVHQQRLMALVSIRNKLQLATEGKITKHDKPVFKAAHLDSSFYIGEEYLDTLSELKSKNELIAEIVSLLQSPAKNVISSLQSSGSKLSGIVKTLAERAEQ